MIRAERLAMMTSVATAIAAVQKWTVRVSSLYITSLGGLSRGKYSPRRHKSHSLSTQTSCAASLLSTLHMTSLGCPYIRNAEVRAATKVTCFPACSRQATEPPA